MPPSEHSGSQNAHKGSNETPRRARQRSVDPATHWQAGPSEAGEQNSEVADAVIRAAARRRLGTGGEVGVQGVASSTRVSSLATVCDLPETGAPNVQARKCSPGTWFSWQSTCLACLQG
jgi:hypothetical protein